MALIPDLLRKLEKLEFQKRSLAEEKYSAVARLDFETAQLKRDALSEVNKQIDETYEYLFGD